LTRKSITINYKHIRSFYRPYKHYARTKVHYKRYILLVFLLISIGLSIENTIIAKDLSFNTLESDKVIQGIGEIQTIISVQNIPPIEEKKVEVIKDIPKPKTLARKAVSPKITYNTGGDCYSYVDEMSQKYGVDAGLMKRIIKAESGGNANAKNRNSSASGCGQFIAGTWSSTLRQMGREWVTPFDARTNVEAMAFKISRGGIGAWNASKSKWNN
jgi:hypothetical protein